MTEKNVLTGVESMSRDAVLKNIVLLNGKRYALSSRGYMDVEAIRHIASGLAGLDMCDVIKNHIDLYLEYVVEGNGPCAFSVATTKDAENRRVTTFSPIRATGRTLRDVSMNLCILLALFSCSETDRSEYFNDLTMLSPLLLFYEPMLRIYGLIRHGTTLQSNAECLNSLLNLQYYEVVRRFREHGIFYSTIQGLSRMENRYKELSLPIFRGRFLHQFFCLTRGILSHNDNDEFTLEVNLLALKWNFFDSANALNLWRSLQDHSLWTGQIFHKMPSCLAMIRRPITKDTNYPGFDPLAAKCVYVTNLMALSGEVAYQMGAYDEGKRILFKLNELFVRDGIICSVYGHKPDFPRIFYTPKAGVVEGCYLLNLLKASYSCTSPHTNPKL